MGTHGEDLAVDHPVATCCRSRRGGSQCAHRRLSGEPRALQSAAWALRLGQLRWLVGCASRPSIHAGQATRCVSLVKRFSAVAGPQQAERTLRARAGLGVGPEAVFDLKFPFLFFIRFPLNSKFKNLYLNIQSSKNYETSFIRFIIF
jgi:hypothetical protein